MPDDDRHAGALAPPGAVQPACQRAFDVPTELDRVIVEPCFAVLPEGGTEHFWLFWAGITGIHGNKWAREAREGVVVLVASVTHVALDSLRHNKTSAISKYRR
jgi:hypothetical protein